MGHPHDVRRRALIGLVMLVVWTAPAATTQDDRGGNLSIPVECSGAGLG